MLAETPDWVGDATAWFALATTAGVMAAGVARWVNRGLDQRIGRKIDSAVSELKSWFKGELDSDRVKAAERWKLNTEQHGDVVAQLAIFDRRLGDTEAFIEHQIDKGGFR